MFERRCRLQRRSYLLRRPFHDKRCCAAPAPRPALDRRQGKPGHRRARWRRLRPVDGQAHQTGRIRVPGRCRRRGRGGGKGLFDLAPHLALATLETALRLPTDHERTRRGAGRDRHLRARQGARRRPGRGEPGPRGHRVRLRHPAAAEGQLLRERLDERGCVLDSPAPRPRRDHQPVQLPGDGPGLVLPDRHRLRQHRGAQAQREGPLRCDLVGGALGRGRTAVRGLQRCPGRQGCRRPPAGALRT